MDAPEYTVTTDPDSWSIHSTIHVVGQIGDWIVFASVVPSLRFAITELRVFPAEGRLPRGRVPSIENQAGQWSGRPDVVPAGGIPWRDVLRQVREGDIKKAARDWMDAVGKYLADAGVTDATYERVATRVARNDRRDSHEPLTPVQRLALLAEEYVQLLDDGEKYPNKILAERHGQEPGWVATEIHRARNRYGLLTKTQKGTARGSLTPRAQQILDNLRDPKEER